eukprot:TRINITY_DN8255_c0_g1_i1.p1 TRINITY_DN8255_c0_g1~~TRINITY_DN8255_c0_g1_i1.p1  ORF type:complete len:440 (-),score=74.39 TRINITY_DN8255_c0_g1_i1:26-1303(-)
MKELKGGESPVWILTSATLMYLSSFLVFPLLPTIIESLSGSLSASARNVGIMYVTQASASFVLSPLVGLWSDKVGRKTVLLFCQVLSLVSMTLIAVAVTWEWLWLMFITRAVNLILAQQIYLAYLSDISPTPKHRSKNYGYFGASMSLALILGPITGGLLGSMNLIFPVLLSGVVMMTNLIFIMLFIEQHEQHKQSDVNFSKMWILLKKIVTSPSWRLLLWIKFLMVIGTQDVNEMFFLYVPAKFNLVPVDIGILSATIGFTQVIWKGFLLRWFITHGEETFYLPGSSISAAISHIGIGIMNNLSLLYILVSFSGISVIAVTVIDSMISIRASKEEQGSILGILGSISTVGEVVGGTAVSLIYAEVASKYDLDSMITGAPFFMGAGLQACVFVLWIVWFQLYSKENKALQESIVKTETEETDLNF